MRSAKRRMHFGPHFKSLWPDTGPQPNLQFIRVLRNLTQTTVDDRLDNALAFMPSQATPAGMGCSHPLALCIGDQQWQTIGHHDGASDTGLRGPTGVGHVAIGAVRMDVAHIPGMDLLQKNGTSAQVMCKKLTVATHLQGIIAHVVTQIE